MEPVFVFKIAVQNGKDLPGAMAASDIGSVLLLPAGKMSSLLFPRKRRIGRPAYTNALAFKADIVVINFGANDSKHPNDGSIEDANAVNNWQHKGDIIGDYKEMIAAFRQGSLNVDMMDFFKLLAGRDYFSTNMYLDVVEAGFEVVRGRGWVTCGWFSCETR